MNDSFDSGNFKERDYLSLVWKRKRDHPVIWKKKRHYLPLIQKDSVNHIHGLVVYVKQGLPFIQDLSLEKSADSYWCFQLALLLFPLLITFSIFMHAFWCYFIQHRWSSLNKHVCLCICFWRLNVHHKDWLTYSGGTNIPGELCFNLSISNDLTQMVNFPQPCSFGFVFLLMLVFVQQWISLHWEIQIMLSQFLLTSHQLIFQFIAYDYFRGYWDGLHNHFRYVL